LLPWAIIFHAVGVKTNRLMEIRENVVVAFLTINQQKRLVGGDVLVESLKQVAPLPNSNDNEQILDGMAEITKYQGKGFNINLPEIYRRLRQLFNE